MTPLHKPTLGESGWGGFDSEDKKKMKLNVVEYLVNQKADINAKDDIVEF